MTGVTPQLATSQEAVQLEKRALSLFKGVVESSATQETPKVEPLPLPQLPKLTHTDQKLEQFSQLVSQATEMLNMQNVTQDLHISNLNQQIEQDPLQNALLLDEDQEMSDSDEAGNLTTAESKKRKLHQKQAVCLPEDNCIKMYNFLERMSGGLEPSQIRNIH
jgi:hypothetical protein